MKKTIARLLVGGLFLSTAAFAAPTATKTATTTKNIRWVLAHEPVGLFRRAAEHFKNQVESKSHGQLTVEVLTIPEYKAKYAAHGDFSQDQVISSIQKGTIEMSQTYTTALGPLAHDLYVLDLPFLFHDYAHAQKILEGKVGGQLLASLEPQNIHGLAFTYSGGYRVIPTEKPIHHLADFKGMKVRTSGSPVAQDTFLAIGAKPVALELEHVGPAMKRGSIEAAESTYSRFYAMKQNEFSTSLLDSRHSLFLTSIIVNKEFFSHLTPEQQKIVKAASASAARIERNESIADESSTKQKCEKEGIQITSLAPEDVAQFKKITQPIYKKYENYFSSNLIAEIEKEQAK